MDGQNVLETDTNFDYEGLECRRQGWEARIPGLKLELSGDDEAKKRNRFSGKSKQIWKVRFGLSMGHSRQYFR